MRRVVTFIGLQAYAFAFAVHQLAGWVRTDEAKYLLNIPYPHPPFIRSIFSLTESFAYHEFLWRILLASLVVHAVWLVWDMGRELKRPLRYALCACWLFAGGVILGAGTIMLAPVNAVFGLALLWLATVDRSKEKCGLIALVWLASLFSAYQAVLYAPIAFIALRRHGASMISAIAMLCVPLVLLGLYTIANPLALASLIQYQSQSDVLTIAMRAKNVFWLFAVGGAGVVTVLGVIGLAFEQRVDRIISVAMMTVYFWFSALAPYYAILLVPILVDGCRSLLVHLPARTARPIIFVVVLSGAFCAYLYGDVQPTAARSTIGAIEAHAPAGDIVIAGAFGHEWQYETKRNVHRYMNPLPETVTAIVCLQSCPSFNTAGWAVLSSTPVTAWVRLRVP